MYVVLKGELCVGTDVVISGFIQTHQLGFHHTGILLFNINSLTICTREIVDTYLTAYCFQRSLQFQVAFVVRFTFHIYIYIYNKVQFYHALQRLQNYSILPIFFTFVPNIISVTSSRCACFCKRFP